MAKVLRIEVVVVHSDWEEIAPGTAKLRTVENAATLVADKTRKAILDQIPKGRFCSVVIGMKEEEE